MHARERQLADARQEPEREELGGVTMLEVLAEDRRCDGTSERVRPIEVVVEALTAPRADEGPTFVPIDGKTVRGSYTEADKSNPLHLVSAWATKPGITLGQVATDQKSNEITAIPQLLKMIELRGAIVTIDAMGCQKKIAKKIVKGGGDYGTSSPAPSRR